MKKFLFVTICFFGNFFLLNAQYTETINSNRPGNSQGAFAVGTSVLQLETGVRLGKNEHALRNTETDIFGIDYELRYGIGFENLEVSWMGSFLFSNEKIPSGASQDEIKYSNFEYNTLGFKYLIYDPYKRRSFEKPNIRSWKANLKFKWRDLIPAVSVYAGANLAFGDSPYMVPNEPEISPRIALITQQNYRSWVFVMNFISDKLTSDFRTYAGIFTLTHSFNSHLAAFGEFQVIKSDFYSDNILRAGGAYLISKDFQVDLSGLINFKDTPSRWQAGIGVSYRLDMHSIDELIISKEAEEKLEEKEEIKEKQEKFEQVKPKK